MRNQKLQNKKTQAKTSAEYVRAHLWPWRILLMPCLVIISIAAGTSYNPGIGWTLLLLGMLVALHDVKGLELEYKLQESRAHARAMVIEARVTGYRRGFEDGENAGHLCEQGHHPQLDRFFADCTKEEKLAGEEFDHAFDLRKRDRTRPFPADSAS